MKKQFVFLIVGVIALLCVPFIAGYFTAEVNWNLFDYLIMGLLLTSAGALSIVVYNRFKDHKYKYLYIAIIGMALLLLYIELAVGVFGSPVAGN